MRSPFLLLLSLSQILLRNDTAINTPVNLPLLHPLALLCIKQLQGFHDFLQHKFHFFFRNHIQFYTGYMDWGMRIPCIKHNLIMQEAMKSL